jgi:hypothetical protein
MLYVLSMVLLFPVDYGLVGLRISVIEIVFLEKEAEWCCLGCVEGF